MPDETELAKLAERMTETNDIERTHRERFLRVTDKHMHNLIDWLTLIGAGAISGQIAPAFAKELTNCINQQQNYVEELQECMGDMSSDYEKLIGIMQDVVEQAIEGDKHA